MDNIWSFVIETAKNSLESGDIPVGALIVRNNEIIGIGYNTREKKQSIIGHAEINAILNASGKISNWNLSDCEMYVTLKPCNMCQEVIKQSRLKNVYYLLDKPSNKKEYSSVNFKKVELKLQETEYNVILSAFFTKLRAKNK